jgi:hypothetical protein
MSDLKRSHRLKRLDSESGITLIETIIAAAMAVVVTGAATAMLISALQRQPDLTQRADQIGKARIGTDKMVRDIRQGVIGTVAGTSTEGKVEFESYVDGRCGTTTVTSATKCKVVIQCASEVCSRTTGTSATTSERIVEGVKNASTVFQYVKGPSPCSSTAAETPTFIAVTLELKSKKGGVTKIEDGAGLRSCS